MWSESTFVPKSSIVSTGPPDFGRVVKGENIMSNEDQSIRVEFVFNAPRETVWRALTEPELIERWLMPNDFSLTRGAASLFEPTPRRASMVSSTVRSRRSRPCAAWPTLGGVALPTRWCRGRSTPRAIQAPVSDSRTTASTHRTATYASFSRADGGNGRAPCSRNWSGRCEHCAWPMAFGGLVPLRNPRPS